MQSKAPSCCVDGSINKNNPLTLTFLLMSSRSIAQVIFTHPAPAPAGSPETSLHCTLSCPGFLGSVAGLLPLISCKPTKLLLQRQRPLAVRTCASSTTSRCRQLPHFFTHYCTVLYWTELNWKKKENIWFTIQKHVKRKATSPNTLH